MFFFLLAMALTMTREEAEKLAIEALVREKGFEAREIEVRRASAVDWPDASLGCPEPDRAYAQVVTPGYRVTLQARGETFYVHVAPSRAVVCETELEPRSDARPRESLEVEADDSPAIPLPEEPKLRKLVLEARADLAGRLGVEAEAIELLEARDVVWPDASLGCPRPGVMYAQVIREGYLVRLRSAKRVYRYHASAGGAPFLCESPR